MNSKLLRWHRLTKKTRFAWTSVEVNPPLQNWNSQDHAWLQYWTHMGGSTWDAPSQMNPKWIRYKDEADLPERVPGIIERLPNARNPFSPGPLLVVFAGTHNQFHFFRACAHWEDCVFAEHRICGLKRYRLVYCWNRNRLFYIPALFSPRCNRMLRTADLREMRALSSCTYQLRLSPLTFSIIFYGTAVRVGGFAAF